MRIAIIQGHPDAAGGHYCNAVAAAYEAGAAAAGHEVRVIEVAQRQFPLLRSKAGWEEPVPETLEKDHRTIEWAEHLVVIYPLWLGTLPALLKSYFEQLFRPGFAFDLAGQRWKKRLTGKSARVIVTMGMPAFVYRWYFGAHSLKSLERNILAFVGMKPVRSTVIGMVEGSASRRKAGLQRIGRLGQKAA